MRDLVVALIIFGAVPFILSKPSIGVLMWSWISYMVPHRLAWSWMQHMPVAQVTGVATILGALATKDRQKLPMTPLVVVWLVFVAYMTLATVFAQYPEAAWPQWSKVMKVQFFALLTIVLITNRERLHQLLWVVTLSIGFYGLKGGLYTLQGGTGLVWGPPGGYFAGNNELALTLLVTMPLMYFLLRQTPRLWIKVGLAGTMTLSLIAVIGTFSRGAFVAAGCMGLFFWWKSGHRILVGLLGTLVVAGALSIAPTHWWERMGTIQTYEQDGSAMGRIAAWQVAIGVASNRPLGGGFQCFTPENFRAYGPPGHRSLDVHSIYFEVLGENGWGALALFVTLGFLAWRTGSWIIRTAGNDPTLAWYRNLAAMAQVSLIAYASGGAFLGLAYFDLPYTIIGALVISRLLLERDLAARAVEFGGSPEPAGNPTDRPAASAGVPQYARR